MNVQRISLDLAKRTGNQHVIIAQGDNEGTIIVATIYDNGTKLAETGLTAHFLMKLPDGLHYVRDEDASYDDGVVTYVVNEDYAASVAGFTDTAYFELHKGDQIVSTERFSVTVEPSAYDGMTAGETYDTIITQLLTTLQAGIDELPNLADAATSADSAALSATDAAALANEAAARAESAVAHSVKIWFEYQEVGDMNLLTLCTTEGDDD